MFSVLVHDLGKALTEPTGWPHTSATTLGLPRVEAICERLKVPVRVRKLALAVTEQHLNAHRAPTLRAGKVLSLLERVGGFGQGSFCTSSFAPANATRAGDWVWETNLTHLTRIFCNARRRPAGSRTRTLPTRGCRDRKLGRPFATHEFKLLANYAGQTAVAMAPWWLAEQVEQVNAQRQAIDDEGHHAHALKQN